MSDELKEFEELIGHRDSELFENYSKPKRFGSKFWLNVVLIFFVIFFAVLYKYAVLDNIIPTDVLLKSIEIKDIDSQWVVKEEVNEPDFKGVIVVPQVTFRLRNVGDSDLKYVYILGVFRVPDRTKTLGEASYVAFKKPLKPGQESEPITMTSNFGYKTTSKKAFALNDSEWQFTSAELYAKCGSFSFELFKKFPVSRKIEGMKQNVKYQFVN